ncbi:hypothetical protein [Vibrio parahaemolyticus]|uniref:hypothetical protein n=1 Tax=Vibrio parahaemolyticus TaxID=670 RepID=UPI00040E4B0E|nr:hypothetical protein [Vibrio parahaemolyticus]HAS6555971.1 hypothetical protein [Vibrio parahaemolyticus]
MRYIKKPSTGGFLVTTAIFPSDRFVQIGQFCVPKFKRLQARISPEIHHSGDKE